MSCCTVRFKNYAVLFQLLPRPLCRATVQPNRERVAAANDCAVGADVDVFVVLAAFILAAIEHFNHLVLALSGSKLCFLIIVVSSSFINCCISV